MAAREVPRMLKMLNIQMLNISDQRLLSRRSVWNFDPHPSTKFFSIPDAWTAAWSATLPVNGDLIMVSTYDDIIGCC
jgi:hypothetical protein